MKYKLRKIVKEEIDFLIETLGVQNDIKKFSDYSIEKILDRVLKASNELLDGHDYTFNIPISTTDLIRENTKIEYVDFQIEHKLSNNFKFGGSFNQDKTWLLDNGFYKVTITIKIESNVNNIEIDGLHALVSHELSHSYKYIKQLYNNSINKSKTNKLNRINKINRTFTSNLLEKNYALKEFSRMFYLALSQEVDARIQETETSLQYINKKDYNETIEALGKYNPINDARKMMNYNLNELYKIDEKILKQFVDSFNSIIIKQYGDKLKLISNTKSFFEYYLKFININGNRLYRNIMKLVAEKHNLEENYMIVHMDSSLANKVLGERFDFDDFI